MSRRYSFDAKIRDRGEIVKLYNKIADSYDLWGHLAESNVKEPLD